MSARHQDKARDVTSPLFQGLKTDIRSDDIMMEVAVSMVACKTNGIQENNGEGGKCIRYNWKG